MFNYPAIAEIKSLITRKEKMMMEERMRMDILISDVSGSVKVDEFTKATAYTIVVEASLIDLVIRPSKMIVNDEGDLIEKPFMTLWFKECLGESVKIMIDGKLQKVSGDGWEKKFISEMKKGKEIIVRAYFPSIDKTLTGTANIISFAPHWNRIPEEYIFFSDKDQKKESEDQKKEPEETVVVGDLDLMPRLLNRPSTRYPSALLKRGIPSGKVVLEVTISTIGEVKVNNVLSSTHPELTKMATTFASRARFSIPKKDGKPVEAIFRWPMTLQAPK